MSTIITSVDRHSPAERAGIAAGEQLLAINGHEIIDVLDYRFYGYDTDCRLELREPSGAVRTVSLRKPEGRDLGLNFDTVLMDEMRSCANHCIFCFVDQMPPGMRKTLYFKDDDARLSFLQGNYITLTNLTDREAQRIIDLRISPINVSVHTTDPQLHCTMLGNKNALRSLDYIRAFCKAGIVMNGQIVVCPGWNDGDQLRRTLRDLTEMQFSSCSLVPVGITKYRQGLAKLRPVDAGHRRRDHRHRRRIRPGESGALRHPALLLRRRAVPAGGPSAAAGRSITRAIASWKTAWACMRSLEDDFLAGLATVDVPARFSPFTIATGTAAAPFLRGLVQRAMGDYPGLRGQVIAVENDFFGHTIDVAGLLTGQDISAQLRGRDLGDRVLIPIHMMRHGETVFLDDYTVERLSRELGVPVQVVDEDGFALVDAMFAAE